MADRKISVSIVGDASSLEKAFGRASSAGKKFSVGFGTFLKGAVVFEGVRAAVDLVGQSLHTAAGEWKDQVTVAAQTNAALKSTGGIAGVTAGHIDELAGAVSRYSGQDDEAVQAAENLLLTFKAVHNETGKGNQIFDRATKAAVDLAQAGFGSLSTNAKQLGKVLNDPVKGMTALTRAGVTFTAGQRETIKKLAETGHLLEAQKLVLKEVESQVGGSAKAFGQTLPGQLARARESIKNVLGDLFSAAAPALTAALGGVNKFIDALGKARTVRAKLNVVLETGRDLVQQGLRVANEVRQRVGDALAQVDWRDVGQKVGDGLSKALSAVAAFVGKVDWSKVGQAIVHGIVEFLKGVPWGPLLKATGILIVKAVIALDKLLFAAAKELGKAILQGIVAGTQALAGLVVQGLKKLPGEWLAVATFYLNQAKRLGGAIIDGIGKGLDNAKDFVLKKLLAFVNKILGVTGFLGRFDPFKGTREKVQARLREMEGDTKTSSGKIQRTLSNVKGHKVKIMVSEHGVSDVQAAIDGVKGKDVFINIKTTVTQVLKGVGAVAVGVADSAATAGDNSVAQAATKQAQKQADDQTDAANDIKKRRQAAARAAARAAAAAQAAAEAAATAFENLIGSFNLKLDKARLTATFKDDLRVLDQIQAAIKKRIGEEGKTLDLQRQLFDVQQQIADATRQQRQSKQFEALGLTATGDTKVAGVGALLKKAGSLKDAIKGTILDTPKTRSQLQQITKVLSGHFGKLGRDVREAILGMLNDISGALSQGSKTDTGGVGGEITRGGIRSTQKLIKGLGLTPEQAAALQRRNLGVSTGSHRSAFGFALGGGSGGAGSVSDSVFVIHNHIHLDGKEIASSTTRQQQKRARQVPGSRRGTHGGTRLAT